MTILDTVYHDADPFAQSSSRSCWAAGAVILFQWKKKRHYTELEMAQLGGPEFVTALNDDTGLRGPRFADFATRLGLSAEAPQNFTPDGYHTLLKRHGPLWIAAGLDAGGVRRHVRVLRGISGDGSFDHTQAWILDPDQGQAYQSSMSEFARELENIARDEVDAGRPLFTQAIHF
ncbi:papain-like cysteine protease family protein [Janthinobacterium sp. PSPC3-1]|uniref:papain-like cysteine protease family protein n=1 Tax=Janthinobacterium sp. PSPC3-1 TaxID=2804653 RepID=UPI003CFAA830